MPGSVDSGYGSHATKMPRRGSNISHNMSQGSGKYNQNMLSPFHPSQMWQDTPASPQAGATVDHNYPSPTGYQHQTAIDPNLIGINPTDNNNEQSLIDQFNVDLPQTFSLQDFPQNESLFSLSQQTDAQPAPWISRFQGDNIMHRMDQSQPQQESNHKRRRLNNRTGSIHASQSFYPSSDFTSSPARSANPQSSKFPPNSIYPGPSVSEGGFPSSRSIPQMPTPLVPQRSSEVTSFDEDQDIAVLDGKKPARLNRRHSKTYSCGLCPPNVGKQFNTVNDLDRHKKTVHKIIPKGDRVWKCDIDRCKSSNKIWPRLDNFKQHVKRMHGAEHCNRADGMHVQYDPEKHGDVDTESQYKSQPSISEDVSGLSTDVAPRTPAFKRSPRLPAIDTQSHERSAKSAKHLSPHDPHRVHSLSSTRHPSAPRRTHRSTSITHGLRPSLTRPDNQIQLLPPGDFRFPTHRPFETHTVANPETFNQNTFDDNDTSDVPFPIDPFHNAASFAGMGEFWGNDQSAAPNNTLDSTFSNATGEMPSLIFSNSLARVSDEHNSILQAILQRPPEEQKTIVKMLHEKIDVQSLPTAAGSTRSVPPKSSTKDKKADGQKELKCTKMVKSSNGGREPCPKTFSSGSELRKHEKRHDRRYGCTFDGCYKQFGTKWEWTRHEHNQHTQLEIWRCQIKVGEDEKVCAQTFSESSDFERHLREFHSDTNEAQEDGIKTFVKERWIAKKFQGSYWCGYCNKILKQSPQTPHGVEMIKQRDMHVSGHIDRYDREANEWVELHGQGKTKEQRKHADDSEDDADDANEPPSTTSRNNQTQTQTQRDHSASAGPQPESKRRLTTTQSAPYSSSRSSIGPTASPLTPTLQVTDEAGQINLIGDYHHDQTKTRVCCHCHFETDGESLDPVCPACQHTMCPNQLCMGNWSNRATAFYE